MHPRFEFAPRDDRSSKNEPNRVENDRDMSLQSWEFRTLFLPRPRDREAPARARRGPGGRRRLPVAQVLPRGRRRARVHRGPVRERLRRLLEHGRGEEAARRRAPGARQGPPGEAERAHGRRRGVVDGRAGTRARALGLSIKVTPPATVIGRRRGSSRSRRRRASVPRLVPRAAARAARRPGPAARWSPAGRGSPRDPGRA